MDLSAYRTFGRSGLAVSPLALGTMTFGTARWGMPEDRSRAVFDAYVEAGGNFVDTADVYAGGRSEEMIGGFIAERRLRERIVLATKSGFASGSGPHAGGNGAKHIGHALDGSLARLRTDYIDLYWVHVWDGVTPAEELLETMAAQVRAGRIRYWGMSNAPAWYIAKIATLAAVRGLPGPIGLQFFYSLVSRDIEDEHLPLARDFAMGVLPWSPLAYGLLTGKYDRAVVEASAPGAGGLPGGAGDPGAERPSDDKRLDGANPFGGTLFTPRNWQIVDDLRQIAAELGSTPARLALAWLLARPQVPAILIGVSRVEQLHDNIGALGLALSTDAVARLDEISRTEPRLIYGLSSREMRRNVVFGGAAVSGFHETR